MNQLDSLCQEDEIRNMEAEVTIETRISSIIARLIRSGNSDERVMIKKNPQGIAQQQ